MRAKQNFWASKKRWLIWLTILAFNYDQLKKKGKHGMYNVKTNVGKYNPWYMKTVWKYSMSLLMAK